MLVRFWGTRGSLPVAMKADTLERKIAAALVAAGGQSFADEGAASAWLSEQEFAARATYGGATSCVEIETGAPAFFVCDAGSGLREFGLSAMGRCAGGHPRRYNLFLSHLHWDHIMGFPFFVPAFDPAAEIVIHAGHADAEMALRRQQEEISFPVAFDWLRANIRFVTMTPGVPIDVDGVEVVAMAQHHSHDSYGYRFTDAAGRSAVYSTDSEHKTEKMDAEDAFVDFFRGADLVVCDTMYSLADTVSLKEDWGHSSNIVAVDLCRRAAAKRLALFHHEPTYRDEDIERMHAETLRYEELTREGAELDVICAYDGLEVQAVKVTNAAIARSEAAKQSMGASAHAGGSSMRQLRLSGLAAALIAAVLVLLLGASLRTPLFDLWQRLGPRDLSDTQVRVVLIDDESLKGLGPWPWPRFYLAKLTQAIGERGAAAIGFDAFFPEPDRIGPVRVAELYPDLSGAAKAELAGQPSPDQQFALAIGEYPVVLARAGTHEAQGTNAPATDARLPSRLPDGFLRYPRALTAIPELDMVALGHGLANAEPDADGLYRKLPLLARVGDTVVPGLAVEVARVALGEEAIGLNGDRARLGARALPVTARGEMRLRFGPFPVTRTISAIDLLRPGAGPDLRGTAVLVGLAAAGTSDIAATPIEAKQYGVLVQAQALDAILRGDGWLERPRWAWAIEWGLALALTALALWLLPRRGRGQWLVPAAGAIVLGGAWLAFDQSGLLIDPLPALTLMIASAVAIGFASLQQTRRERERLRETLVEERVTAAANEAELDAARSIQQAMLPRPEALARLDPRVTVAAVLEPARSVGGDFFDVVDLGGGRLAFLIADVTGKGVSAALFMALSKALAKSALLREPLGALAATIQREVSRDAPEEMGLTMLLGVLDLATGEARMINAGHENPVVIRPGGGLETIAMEGGPPFCIVDYPWPVETIRLKPGDMLVLFTDGATEAQTAEGRLFGAEHVHSALQGAGPSEVLASLVETVRTFEDGAPPSDDLTVMVLRYEG